MTLTGYKCQEKKEKEFWRPEVTCHSESTERSPGNVDVKKLLGNKI